jgi:hypothetical protein
MCWQAVEYCAAEAHVIPSYRGLAGPSWLEVVQGLYMLRQGQVITPLHQVASADAMRAVPAGDIVLIVSPDATPDTTESPIKHAMICTGEGHTAGSKAVPPITDLWMFGAPMDPDRPPMKVQEGVWQEADMAAQWDIVAAGMTRARRQVVHVPMSALRNYGMCALCPFRCGSWSMLV